MRVEHTKMLPASVEDDKMPEEIIAVFGFGGAGRDHAMLAMASRNEQFGSSIAITGNGGTTEVPGNTNVILPMDNVEALTQAAVDHGATLALIGPEILLQRGLADALRAKGIPTLGPEEELARIETSKIHGWRIGKRILASQWFPTSRPYSSLQAAEEYIRSHRFPEMGIAVKADGLVGGKGVELCRSKQATLQTVRRFMGEHVLGSAGSIILLQVIEVGTEVSLISFCNGEDALSVLAYDYKRLDSRQNAPMTGGMGAFCIPDENHQTLADWLTKQIVVPILRHFASQGTPYRGVLYTGLMFTEHGWKILEFNCRLGDPEAQVILPLLAPPTDFLSIARACAHGSPLPHRLIFKNRVAVGMVLAADGYGYTNALELDQPIWIAEDIKQNPNILVFHGGTYYDRYGQLRVDNGRVMTIVGIGDSLDEARRNSERGGTVFTEFSGKTVNTEVGNPDRLLPESAFQY